MNTDNYPFTFNASTCQTCGGRCCVGESGYVFISIEEMSALSSFLNLSFETFTQKYVRKVGYRFSLIEKAHNDGLACIFFDASQGQCSIYEYRPKQCRTFPFWESHKSLDHSSLTLIEQECPGIVIKEKR